MPAPNLLLIGPPKSGSTSLYYYMKQHPDIYLPAIKEIGFFRDRDRERHHVSTFEEYCRFYDGATHETILAEVCPLYLARPEAPGMIKQYIPDTKMVAVLRNPVDRIISGYKMRNRQGIIDAPFETILQNMIDGTISPRFETLFSIGFYAKHLKNYHKVFPAEQLKIMFYEDLQSDIHGFLKELFDFIGVRSDVQINTQMRHNSASYPRSVRLYNLYRRVVDKTTSHYISDKMPAPIVTVAKKVAEKMLLGEHPYKTSPETRQKLKDFYRDSIVELEDYLHLDLAHWKR